MALTKVRGVVLSDELYRRENNLIDVPDKAIARNNLSVYSKAETFAKIEFTNFVFMFAGYEQDIPVGFQLCNGIGSTSKGIPVPDLQDRFVICSGDSYPPGSTGGSASAQTSINGNHSHSIIVDNRTTTYSVPNHRHAIGGIGTSRNWGTESYSAVSWDDGAHTNKMTSLSVNEAHSNSMVHNHSASCNSIGDHSHTVSTISPYYALAFIIKL